MFREILKLWAKADLLQQSFQTAGKMMEVTREMFVEVTRITLDHQPSSFDVHRRDKDLNVMEKEIRRKVLEHLAIGSRPDIVPGLVLVTVVNDIERIGDYTKNIEELVKLYPDDFSNLSQAATLRKCGELVLSFFDLTREAFEVGNQAKAEQVMKQHKEVRIATDSIIEYAFQDPVEDKKAALVSVLFARYLKRISAHLKNIATSVVKPFDEIGYSKPPRISEE
jgi:phosphate uptake regulator